MVGIFLSILREEREFLERWEAVSVRLCCLLEPESAELLLSEPLLLLGLGVVLDRCDLPLLLLLLSVVPSRALIRRNVSSAMARVSSTVLGTEKSMDDAVECCELPLRSLLRAALRPLPLLLSLSVVRFALRPLSLGLFVLLEEVLECCELDLGEKLPVGLMLLTAIKSLSILRMNCSSTN